MPNQGKVKELSAELMYTLTILTKLRINQIGFFILALVKVISVNLVKIVLAMDTKGKKGSNYRRLQQFRKDLNCVNVDYTSDIIVIKNGRHNNIEK